MTNKTNYDEFDSYMLTERIKAIIRLALPLLATGASYLGFSFDVEQAWCMASGAVGLLATIGAWWYNNNMTEPACHAQQDLNTEKELMKEAKHA